MKSSKGKSLNAILIAGSIFAFLLALFVIYSLQGIVKVYRLRAEEQKLKQEITLIKKSNYKIDKQIYELIHNRQYIANLAREKLNMIKKGEIVFKFIHKKKKDSNKKNK
ncbi:MAG: septum formation initiator family protein [Deltaproteobacteria bacterium]|jgi:cell division protein FtsB|nr:septum formation initiator family protein [Deltaproteobacteria bacterium]MCL5892519.1 septum formation initiator family protein [Deltaproteobacteria bacterium]